MWWIQALLGLADPIEKITAAIVKARADSLNATTEQQKIAAQEQIAELQARRDVLIAEAGVSRANMIVRAFLAAPVIVVIAKLLVWDKVIGSLVGCSMAPRGTCLIFTTDPLDENMWKLIFIEIGFYFLYEGAVSISRIVKR